MRVSAVFERVKFNHLAVAKRETVRDASLHPLPGSFRRTRTITLSPCSENSSGSHRIRSLQSESLLVVLTLCPSLPKLTTVIASSYPFVSFPQSSTEPANVTNGLFGRAESGSIAMKIYILVILFLTALACPASGAESPTITNSDITKMAKASLPDSTIILAIQNGRPEFDLSPAALIELRANGISPGVIEAMMIRNASARDKTSTSASLAASEDEVKQLLAAIAHVQSDGVISVISFRKTDGQSRMADGVSAYRMEFEAVLEFSETAKWADAMFLPAQLNFRIRKRPPVKPGGLNFFDHEPGPLIGAGSVFLMIGMVMVEKTENGWKIVRGEMRSIQPTQRPARVAAGEQRTVAADKYPTRLHSVPAIDGADLASVFSAQGPTSTQEGLAKATSESGTVAALIPAAFTVERGRKDQLRLIKVNADGLKDIITVECIPTALLTPNPALSRVTESWRKDDLAANPGAKITDTIPARLVGKEASCYGMSVIQEGRPRQTVCTVTVFRKHLVAVHLNTSPETAKASLEAYRAVIESLSTNLK
jgi:hypothetical protein